MSEIHSVYPAAVRWEGGRRGRASSTDGLPALSVAAPPSFGGPSGVWSPEHLFVLSATACWMTTFLAVAQASKVEVAAVECSGTGTLVRDDDRRFRIGDIVLRPIVTVFREEDRERVIRLIHKAEAACLIRNSIRSDVALESQVMVKPAPSAVPA